MPEILSEALSQEGLVWLVTAAFAAGVVRGFTGFGTAMVYLPIAGQVLSPIGALVSLTIMDLFGPLPNVPRALKDAHLGDIARLCAGLLIALPLGLLILTSVAPEVFRYSVSIIALILLALLITGWRYRGVLTQRMVFGTGMLGGFLFGAAGLSGPPVIMIYMASTHAARVIRANLMLYLLGADVLMVLMLGGTGRLSWVTVVTGLVVTVPYLIGNVLGGWLFRPDLEKIYRIAAYVIIAFSALSGLPFFD